MENGEKGVKGRAEEEEEKGEEEEIKKDAWERRKTCR